MKLDQIDEIVKELEEGVSCPETNLAKIMMDHSLVKKAGLKTDPTREFTWVWALHLGGVRHFSPPLYGNTIREVFERALKAKKKGELWK